MEGEWSWDSHISILETGMVVGWPAHSIYSEGEWLQYLYLLYLLYLKGFIYCNIYGPHGLKEQEQEQQLLQLAAGSCRGTWSTRLVMQGHRQKQQDLQQEQLEQATVAA